MSTARARQVWENSRLGEKGTILLEEIAEMPAGVQFKLLQVLQNNELRTAAGSDLMPAHVRILAASSANLDRVLAEQQLREDLYHRLSAFTLQVPPLRQRKDEIATLLRYFMHNLARHYGLPPRGFSSGMLAACQHYSWPGNLKELEAFVKRYLVAGDQESVLTEIATDQPARVDNGSISIQMNLGEIPGENGGKGETKPKSESLKSLVQDVKSEAERSAIGAALDEDRLESQGGRAFAESQLPHHAVQDRSIQNARSAALPFSASGWRISGLRRSQGQRESKLRVRLVNMW